MMTTIYLSKKKTSIRQVSLLLFVFFFHFSAQAQNDAEFYYDKAMALHEEPDSFIFYAEKAIPFLKEAQSWDKYFNTLAGLRDAHFLYKKNIKQSTQLALDIETEILSEQFSKNIDVQTSTLNRLADYYAKYRSNYPKAIECLDLVVSILDQIEDEEEKAMSQANMFSNLGYFYKSKGDTYTATNYYKEAIRKLEGIRPLNLRNLAIINYNLAKALTSIGELEGAQKAISKSVSYVKKIKPDAKRLELFIALYDIESELNANQATNALDKLNSIRSTCQSYPDLLARWQLAKARALFQTKQKKQCLNAFDEAIEAHIAAFDEKHIETAKTYYFYALALYEFGEYPLALKALKQSLVAFNDTSDPDSIEKGIDHKHAIELVRSFYLKGKIQSRLGLKKEAVRSFDTAAGYSIDSRRQFDSDASKYAMAKTSTEILENGVKLSYELYQSNREEQYIQRAFDFIEKGKSIQLLDALQEAEAAGLSQLPDSINTRLKQLQHQINTYDEWLAEEQDESLEKERVHANMELDNLKKNIAKDYPTYHSYRFSNIKNPIASIQKRLSNEAVLFNFFENKNLLYTIKITPNSLAFYQDTLSPSLLDNISEISHFVQSNEGLELNNFVQKSQHIYQELLGNKIDLPSEHIILVPSPSIYQLPFEVLISENTTAQKWSALPYLTRSKTIQYAYSTLTWVKQKDIQIHGKSTLGIAPIFKQKERELSTLSFSAQELESLEGDIYIGKTASSRRFLEGAPQARLIHLSTHASFLEARHDAKIEFIDAPLMLRDIYGLSLSNDLTFLSACETARGEARTGEGLMSLARGFAYAGSKSIIATLWQVNDASTARIVKSFYSVLESGETKAKALKIAKLAYLDDPSILQSEKAPYYWASAVFMGADNPLELSEKSYFNNYLLIFGIVLIAALLIFIMKRYKT